ncbi:metallophosphoesterase [Bacteroidales bacterium OttesenSCG-928-I14]|nr:metallophosphoesterase [Bacteroidales bacterium OttesenSCG-928-I14]
MVFFWNSIYAQIFLNGYYLFRIGRNKKMPKGLKWSLIILILLEVCTYFVGYFGRELIPFEYYSEIQRISAFWVIASMYFAVLLSIYDLVWWLNKRWVFRVQFRYKVLFTFFTLATIGFYSFIVLNTYIGRDNYAEPQVKEFGFDIDSPTLPNDSIRQLSYKILTVSDMHLGYVIGKEATRKYVDFINAQSPDIIVINGDMVDYYIEPLDEQEIDKELKRLYAPKGVYFIAGNHEYKVDVNPVLDWVRKTGMIVLRDSVVNMDNEMWLIGQDDRKNKEQRLGLENLLSQIDTTKFHILFTHQPTDIPEAYKLNVPLTVAGHTHNGQFFPGNLFRLVMNHFHGRHEYKGSVSVTSSGVGLSGYPFKIKSESEVLIFNIKIY